MNLRNVLSLLCLLALCTVARADRQPAAPDGFSFLVISDSFRLQPESDSPLKQLGGIIDRLTDRPDLVVSAGSLTAHGLPAELEAAKLDSATLLSGSDRFYALPGDRDTRVSPEGKEGFTKSFGGPYQSFDHAGLHFVLLDATIPLYPKGHLDKAQLDWLQKDLKKLKKGAPVVVFVHYALRGEPPSTRAIDNEFDLYQLLDGLNVLAIFTGEGSTDGEWKLNGIPIYACKGLNRPGGSFYRVQVTPLMVTVQRGALASPQKLTTLDRIPIRRPQLSQFRAAWDDPNVPYLERRRPAVTLQPRAVTDNPEKEHAEYRLDDGSWKPMKKDARDIWRDTFLTHDLSIGWHTAGVRLTTVSGAVFQQELYCEIERDETEPTRRWAVDLEGPITTAPLMSGADIVVGSLDGKLTALELKTGKKHWSWTTKGMIAADPVKSSNAILAASTDHTLYAIDPTNGKNLWKVDAGGPLLSSPAVSGSVIGQIAGSRLLGISSDKGQNLWTTQLREPVLASPGSDADTLYVVGREGVTAYETANGQQRWTTPLHSDDLYTASLPTASPAISSGKVFAVSGAGTLTALDARTGQILWTTKPDHDDDPFASTPVVVGLTLYLSGRGPHGDVYAVETATGHIVWQSSTGAPIYGSSPRLAPDGRTMAVMAVRGRVSVLECTSGKRLWGYELGPGNIVSSPAYDGTLVYGGTMANDVQALAGPGKPDDLTEYIQGKH